MNTEIWTMIQIDVRVRAEITGCKGDGFENGCKVIDLRTDAFNERFSNTARNRDQIVVQTFTNRSSEQRFLVSQGEIFTSRNSKER